MVQQSHLTLNERVKHIENYYQRVNFYADELQCILQKAGVRYKNVVVALSNQKFEKSLQASFLNVKHFNDA